MRYLSICSGIEAASVAWHGLGWEPVAFSEIEPFPSAVLKHHYPHVPNLGDMTTLPERILSRELEAPDLLVGGPPCQAFSVAGLRRGLDDARGSLTLTYCEIANAIDHVRLADGRDPAIIVYENVPGLLSSKDNAFGCLLAGLAGESEALQAPRGKWRDAGVVVGPQRLAVWRVLDAQFFAVAQRRRRIFLISVALRHPRAWAIAESIFPLSACLSWNPPSRGEARKIAASGVECGVELCGPLNARDYKDPGTDGMNRNSAKMVPVAFAQNTRDEVRLMNGDGSIVGALAAEPGMKQTCYVAQPVAFHPTQDPISSEDGTTHAMGCGSKQGTATVAVVYERHDQDARVKEVSVAPTLHSKSDNTCDLPMVMQPVGTDCYNGAITGDVAATIGTPGSSVNASGPTVMQAVGSFKPGQSAAARSIGYEAELAPSLEGGGGGNNKPAIHVAMQVRRLTPVECERLQGFPDNWTNIPWRGKFKCGNCGEVFADKYASGVGGLAPAECPECGEEDDIAPECPDGPRYKGLGNSMAVPCMKWIGERIQAATARQEVKP